MSSTTIDARTFANSAPAISRTAAATSTKRLWTGRVLTAIPVLFLIFDGVIKLMNITPVVDASVRLGLPVSIAGGIGTLELVCLAIYLLPRTSFLGAILLTGFLGGATAMHVRIGDPLFSHVLFPSYMGALLWAGLHLRDDRLRALIAPRR